MLSAPTLDALFESNSGADKEIAGADTEAATSTVDIATVIGPSYQELSSDEATPTHELWEMATTPLGLLFYFMPKQLWVTIAAETNSYRAQNIDIEAKKFSCKSEA
ncbi:hypothetical protein L915_14631 [Phytophthora nicotianae]|uniref:PiggyBac transposable element-derived protein domain-containing protein n=1 Tax=Phytophthora nicotianae TaxID=4792 RepID=W2GBF5_PHYNI|nr:hypothetical protein L915_14631 [Phytophthora nicotianae]